jgi:hypothetical protein
MANLTQDQARAILVRLGWRVRSTTEFTRCVKNFQAGWNLGTALAVDGSVGPATSAALLKSESRRKAGQGTASAHFSFIEVQCRCGGKYSSCQRIWQKRKAFQMMEKYRDKSNRSFPVVSGCRCKSHNAAVGGSATSRHVTGLASDTEPRFSTSTVKSWKVATHIGYGSVSKKVKHIDMGSGATLTNPRIYVDGK